MKGTLRGDLLEIAILQSCQVWGSILKRRILEKLRIRISIIILEDQFMVLIEIFLIIIVTNKRVVQIHKRNNNRELMQPSLALDSQELTAPHAA